MPSSQITTQKPSLLLAWLPQALWTNLWTVFWVACLAGMLNTSCSLLSMATCTSTTSPSFLVSPWP
uniref:Macaca fascicularis brain cDNA clone: QtrA-17524, similar to human hypothetical protein FLJ20477 (FLJ20477), mRNA, RefSeq: NM_017837.2 n=1 Tax=Macaca fascicularis TaxID=9541 RepID=I7GB08_MACFA|nr:unnamed protein product [Macaca fascicularis]